MLALALLALALQQTEAPPAAPPPPPGAAPAAAPAPAPARPPRPSRAPAAPKAERAADEGDEAVLTGFDKKSGKRFTGDFDEAEVDDALRQIAEAADWSIVLPPGNHGEISARFKDVPVEDALRAVLLQADLTAAREGGIVTVRARPLISRKVGRDFRRATEEAMREAERATREVEREMRRVERDIKRGGERGDRVVHGDVVVRADQPARDVVAIRGTIRVESGARVRDAVAVLGSVQLQPGAEAREVVAVGGDVQLGAGAQVAQDVVSVGGSIHREEGVDIGGEEVSIGIPALSGLAGLAGSSLLFGDRHDSRIFSVGQVLAKFVVFFALGLLVLALFPRRIDVVAASFTTHPWKAVFTGLLGLVVFPIVVVLLVATLIGIPLVPVAALLVVAAGILGFTALAFHIGRALPLKLERGTNVLQLAIGTAIVVLVTAIPILGWMAWIAALLLTFGAVLRSRFGSQTPVLPTTIPPPPAPPPAAV